MKVLAVFYDRNIGGGQKALAEWVNVLEHLDIKIDVFEISSGFGDGKRYRIRSIFLDFLIFYRSGGFEIAVGTLFGVGKLFALAHILSFGRFKYFYREATNIKASRGIFGRVVTWIIIALSERTIFNSLEQKLDYPFFRRKTLFIPNYVTFSVCTRRQDKSLVMVGRCSRVKRFEIGLYILQALKDFTLHIYTTSGNAIYLNELEQLSLDLGVAHRLSITLDETNKDSLYCHDILLVLSEFEGNPNVMSEAMIRGLPVVASNFKYGLKDMFDSEYCLILENSVELSPLEVGQIEGLHKVPAIFIHESFIDRNINERVKSSLKLLFNG